MIRAYIGKNNYWLSGDVIQNLGDELIGFHTSKPQRSRSQQAVAIASTSMLKRRSPSSSCTLIIRWAAPTLSIRLSILVTESRPARWSALAVTSPEVEGRYQRKHDS